MKVLVTGGNGFIGSHLCELLIEKDHEVTSLDINFDSKSKFLNCEKLTLDITKKDSLEKKIKDFDIIIHLAAVSRVDPAQGNLIKCYNVNVMGVLNIIEIIRNSKTKLIFASSREVYGEPDTIPVIESQPKKPITVYGSSKLAAEQILNIYRKLYDFNHIILRFANVYGSPRDLPQRVIPRFIDLALKGNPLTIIGGNQLIDFTFIDDLVDGISKVVDKISSDGKKIMGEDYNFASGVGTKVIEVAELIKEIFNSNSELTYNQERKYDVQNFIGDFSKAKSVFSYHPKHSLKEGLLKYKTRLENN